MNHLFLWHITLFYEHFNIVEFHEIFFSNRHKIKLIAVKELYDEAERCYYQKNT